MPVAMQSRCRGGPLWPPLLDTEHNACCLQHLPVMKKDPFQSLVQILAVVVICGLPVLGQTPKDLPPLSAVERELKGGETHSFQIQLTAGQFLNANVEQENIDVVTAVFGPDGKQITESDSPNERWGPEPILLV